MRFGHLQFAQMDEVELPLAEKTNHQEITSHVSAKMAGGWTGIGGGSTREETVGVESGLDNELYSDT